MRNSADSRRLLVNMMHTASPLHSYEPLERWRITRGPKHISLARPSNLTWVVKILGRGDVSRYAAETDILVSVLNSSTRIYLVANHSMIRLKARKSWEARCLEGP